MRVLIPAFFLGIVFAGSGICSARDSSRGNCVAFAEANKHVGTDQCVRGTVLHVENGSQGVTILNFCAQAKTCPFTVIVFPSDLKKMGDVRQLEGRQIEVKGTIQDYDGRTEIVLRRTQQLGEAAFRLFPTVPTDYDVERHGHSSPGKFKRPKAAKQTHPKPISIEDPEEPQ